MMNLSRKSSASNGAIRSGGLRISFDSAMLLNVDSALQTESNNDAVEAVVIVEKKGLVLRTEVVRHKKKMWNVDIKRCICEKVEEI